MTSPRTVEQRGSLAFRRRALRGFGGALAFAALTAASASRAQPTALAAPPPRPSEDLWQPTVPTTGFALESSSRFSLGLGAYGGLAVLMNRGGNQPHALVGVLSRARYGFFALGAVIELSDYVEDEWRSVGAFAGAWLPYRNWVDFELAAGLAARRYLRSDPRYGDGGYELDTPALTLRLGVSDRSSEGLLGARLGAEILAALDLRRREARWEYRLSESEVFRGVTPVGGFSLGLALSAGFDVGSTRRVDASQRASRELL